VNILLLDDNPHRITFFQSGLKQHKLTVCRHARTVIKALKKQTFDMIFLDHDLEHGVIDPNDENTGSEVARLIADQAIACDCIVIHSENRAGRDSMETLLEKCHVIPYGKLKKVGLTAILKLADQPKEHL
jgi:CheY-like chemotaxis protein